MSIWAVRTLEPIVTTSSPVLSDEATPSAPAQQEKVVERKKKKAVGKKVKQKVKSSEEEDLSQEQDSLNNREVVQSLIEESVLSYIIERMCQKNDIERFDESFTAFLEVEASRDLKEAHAEVEKAQAEADALKVGLKTNSSEVEHLQKELREECEEMVKLRAKLTLEKEERRKAQEEVNAAMEMALQDFKSSKDMEDIKIDFTEESFLEGF
ncbi:hypothetical protein COCNU_scaffold002951G000030 [Cocos nucifera]|nr:hypothetical protein [Cocos nucifera]EHA8587674.1 hypothetical protein [Cocos nucifera]